VLGQELARADPTDAGYDHPACMIKVKPGLVSHGSLMIAQRLVLAAFGPLSPSAAVKIDLHGT
jgi:hypothetical protein